MNKDNNFLSIDNHHFINDDFILERNTDNILTLKSLNHKDWLPFFIDFTSNDINRRKDQIGLNQDIAKAMGIKKDFKPKILDTTAGLGRDSFLLASLGCEVTMLERNSAIFQLLADAIFRAKNNEELRSIINNMNLINKDSIEFLNEVAGFFDVIYIDPMFPKSKKSRLVKKDMQVFREIVGDDLDSSNLLKLAISKNVGRVVVKRMLKSEYIGDLKPNFEIKSKTIRFDVYCPKLNKNS